MKTQKEISPEQYRKILDGINLIDISLKESRTFLNHGIDPLAELEVKIKDKSRFRLKETGLVDIFHEYELDACEPKSKSPSVQINATYVVQLESSKPFTKDFFNIYKELSLHLNTWPFFREFVHNITSRMNIQPFTLPLWKID